MNKGVYKEYTQQAFKNYQFMRTNFSNINEIRFRFENMHTKEDLLSLLNYVKPILYGENAHPFSLRQISWYYNTAIEHKRYVNFVIKKKSGKYRSIHAPVAGLKSIQRCLAFILSCLHTPHQASFGFETGKTIVENAYKHVGSRYVFNVDLQDFFFSIEQARVWKCLQIGIFERKPKPSNYIKIEGLQPTIRVTSKTANNERTLIFLEYKGLRLINGFYNIIEDNIRYSISVSNTDRNCGKIAVRYPNRIQEVDTVTILIDQIFSHQNEIFLNISPQMPINIIASLCCHRMNVKRIDEFGNIVEVDRNILPQGAPTSPILTNIICKRMDNLLTGLGKRFGLKYSRYADDITFSSGHNVYQENGEFRKELKRIIKDQGFVINDEKTRLQGEGFRQEVTGLLVNHKVNTQKRYLKQLRTWIYLLEKNSISKAQNIIQKHYYTDKGNVKLNECNILHVIAGKLQYLKMVKGNTNPAYQKLNNRFKIIKDSINLNINNSTQTLEMQNVECIGKIDKNNIPNIIEQIFDIGLDGAMDKL
jgi:hypothetical protein